MNQTLHDKIEAYLSGTMPPDERQSFEQSMVTDPSVAEEVALYQLEREGHELLIEQELREKSRAWMDDRRTTDQDEPQKSAIIGQYRTPLLWFIGLTLSVVLVWTLYRAAWRNTPTAPPPTEVPVPAPKLPASTSQPMAQTNDPKPVEQKNPKPTDVPKPLLAMAYYQKPDLAPEMRRSGDSDPLHTSLSDAATAWTNNDSRTIIALLKNTPTNDPFYFQTQEMLAHAYFLNKNYPKAAATFASISNGNRGEMSEKAIWYEALARIATGQLNRAKPLLENIRSDAAHPFHEEAVKLWKEMK